MGKSDKKLKPNRLSALRKQYDAFLEEDKKRKERNDYILGKLDKLRTDGAVVPIHDKRASTYSHATVECKRNAVQSLGKSPLCLQNYQQQQPRDILKNAVSESSLLNEISQKYILIPKRRVVLAHDYAPETEDANIFNDNSDWKSKYQILDQLKNEEKEKPISKQPVTIIYDAEQPISTCLETSEPQSKHKHELPERDLPQKINFGRNENLQKHDKNLKNEETILNVKYDNKKETVIANTELNLADFNEPQLTSDYNKEAVQDDIVTQKVINDVSYGHVVPDDIVTKKVINDVSYEYAAPPKYNSNTTQENVSEEHVPSTTEQFSDYAVNENYLVNDFEKQLNPITYEQYEHQETEQEIIENNETDIAPTETIKADEFVQDVSNKFVSEADSKENLQYPIDIINVQDFTPTDDVQLQDGVNVNPEVQVTNPSTLESTDHYDPELNTDIVEDSESHAINTAGIEEFEAEQRELFYQDDQNTAYNQENFENADYSQQQNYQGDNQYLYYEGVPQEQGYPAEINEHAEATERYDPNYDAQYNYQGEQEYTYDQQQQGGYEQQLQQYDQGQYEQLHFQQENYETVDNVQQQLDNEQGYTDPQNIETTLEQPVPVEQETQQVNEVVEPKS